MHNKVSSQEVKRLLKNYGLTDARWQYFSTIDFDIYRITVNDAKKALALRIYADEEINLEDIQSEIEWLAALADQSLHVPKPLPDKTEKFVHTIAAENGTIRYGVMLTWLPGRFFDKGLTPLRLHRVGVLIGHLHTVSERLAKSGKFKTQRHALNVNFDSWAVGEQARLQQLSVELNNVVPLVTEKVQRQLATLGADSSDYGFVHSDLHQWNYLFLGGEAGAIDFSDCGWGHYALDLATVLQYLKYPLVGNWDHRWQYDKLKEALLSGYTDVKCLPSTIEHQIDAYIMARMIFALEWILDDWPQPDYLSWGPQYLKESATVFTNYLNQ